MKRGITVVLRGSQTEILHKVLIDCTKNLTDLCYISELHQKQFYFCHLPKKNGVLLYSWHWVGVFEVI